MDEVVRPVGNDIARFSHVPVSVAARRGCPGTANFRGSAKKRFEVGSFGEGILSLVDGEPVDGDDLDFAHALGGLDLAGVAHLLADEGASDGGVECNAALG